MSLAGDKVIDAVAVDIDKAYRVRLRKLLGYLVLHEVRAVSAGDLLEPPDAVIVRGAGNNIAVAVVIDVIDKQIGAVRAEVGLVELPVLVRAVPGRLPPAVFYE